MMRLILDRALTVIFSCFSGPRLWVPSARYLQLWPKVHPSKSGVAAARRAARKARNRRRQRRHA